MGSIEWPGALFSLTLLLPLFQGCPWESHTVLSNLSLKQHQLHPETVGTLNLHWFGEAQLQQSRLLTAMTALETVAWVQGLEVVTMTESRNGNKLWKSLHLYPVRISSNHKWVWKHQLYPSQKNRNLEVAEEIQLQVKVCLCCTVMCLCVSTYFFVSTDNPKNEDLYTSLRKGTTDKGIIYDLSCYIIVLCV